MLFFLLMALRDRLGLSDSQGDEALMERYRDGDVKAFQTLLERHQKKVFNFILRFIGDRERANDLLQETFLRVVKQRATYTPSARFTTWVFRIARNLSIDELRRRTHRRHTSLDQPTHQRDGAKTPLERIPGDSASGFNHTDAQEIRERVQAAIDELSDEQREVFVMRHLQQMPFKAIAEVVGEKENTVKSRMRYALENLRVALADYAQELPNAVSAGSQRRNS